MQGAVGQLVSRRDGEGDLKARHDVNEMDSQIHTSKMLEIFSRKDLQGGPRGEKNILWNLKTETTTPLQGGWGLLGGLWSMITRTDGEGRFCRELLKSPPTRNTYEKILGEGRKRERALNFSLLEKSRK